MVRVRAWWQPFSSPQEQLHDPYAPHPLSLHGIPRPDTEATKADKTKAALHDTIAISWSVAWITCVLERTSSRQRIMKMRLFF
jgi:hypothetical protein